MTEWSIKKPALYRKWALCPYCKSKTIIFDNTARCHGVWVKCTRGCKQEFQLIIEGGEQKFLSKAH